MIMDFVGRRTGHGMSSAAAEDMGVLGEQMDLPCRPCNHACRSVAAKHCMQALQASIAGRWQTQLACKQGSVSP